MEHKLKAWPVFFEPIWNKEKKFEIRKNDKDFVINDILRLQEWLKNDSCYTGREITATITYILRDFGCLKDKWIIMSLSNLINWKKL